MGITQLPRRQNIPSFIGKYIKSRSLYQGKHQAQGDKRHMFSLMSRNKRKQTESKRGTHRDWKENQEKKRKENGGRVDMLYHNL